MKSLLFVNGGAATALIALKVNTDQNFALPVLLFGLAALLNAFTLVIGYFSQLSYGNACLANEGDFVDEARHAKQWHGRFQTFAIIILLLSLISSAGGMAMTFMAI